MSLTSPTELGGLFAVAYTAAGRLDVVITVAVVLRVVVPPVLMTMALLVGLSSTDKERAERAMKAFEYLGRNRWWRR